MLHDPDIYPDPMEFKPERFNGDEAEMHKVNNLVFGFGRRVCPGMHFAEGTLFAIIATVLATCEILPGLDENGSEVLPKYAYTPGTITYGQLFSEYPDLQLTTIDFSFPEPFTLRLRPRTPQATALLADVSSAVE